MRQLISHLRLCAVIAGTSILAACAPTQYLVKSPEPSTVTYQSGSGAAAGRVALVDNRKGTERNFFGGTLTSTLQSDGAPIEPTAFLRKHMQAEMKARGLPLTFVDAGTAGAEVAKLETFRVQNHRASGFGPFVTFTFAALDVPTPSGPKRVTAFVKRGKVPVWGFDEVIEPTLNQPLSLAVKELSAKWARDAYGAKAPDAAVSQLAASLSAKRDGDSYLTVYALGFTNNPTAIGHLLPLVKDADENVRLAAISSLGTLKATGQMKLLKDLYADRGVIWQDRAMAIKAIGDLGTDESRAFLGEELKRWEAAGNQNEATWTANIIRLYQ
jgi:hypothetical protein